MQSQFRKVSQIAMITAVIIAIYSIISTEINFSDNDIEAENTEVMTYLVTDSLDMIIDSLVANNEAEQKVVSESPKKTKKKKKKVYKKKIKPVSFEEIAGGDDFTNMAGFFAKMKQSLTSDKKLRVAYFGDSITESDLCTSTLRANLQDTLGGQGVGFVPAVSKLSKYRRSIYHTYSGNWKDYSLSRRKDRKFPLGLSGSVAMPSIPVKDTIGYKRGTVCQTSYKIRNDKPIANPQLIILNQQDTCRVEYVVNEQDTLSKVILPQKEIQFITLADSVLTSLDVSYFPQDTCYVYGCDFSTETGIYVDNYSIRGNKGNNFTKLDSSITQQQFANFDYDLLVLHYGANVTDPTMKDYSWYRISMKKNIRYLRNFVGDTPILLLGMADRGVMVDSTWVSSPDIPYLIKEQKRIAKDTNSSFWNLLTALGGENAHEKLFEKGYIKKDRTHFYRGGTRFFGKLTFNKIMTEYSEYLKKEDN